MRRDSGMIARGTGRETSADSLHCRDARVGVSPDEVTAALRRRGNHPGPDDDCRMRFVVNYLKRRAVGIDLLGAVPSRRCRGVFPRSL
jgi:hypothetical protein